MKATIDQGTQELSRRDIYYWKCDRPAAFHGTQSERGSAQIESRLRSQLQKLFPEQQIELRDGGGQGNHLTWIANIDSRLYFVRVENGPEKDDHLEVETHIMRCVARCGIPTPKVYHVDAGRQQVPFAWQVMDYVPARDLNHDFKLGRLDAARSAYDIGSAIAIWQSVPVTGFGHFDPRELQRTGELLGYHQTYPDYFKLNWRRHLSFLEHREFLSVSEVNAIRDAVEQSEDLLTLTQGCLVHKDVAFWNILGDQERITAYIDWDDAVAADEMDDLSLLGCFHDGPVISRALDGYSAIRQLPEEYTDRFWLHLMRNMIVKSVIRVGAGYFERTDGFFLIGSGMTGAEFVEQTRSRLFRVLDGLRSHTSPREL